MQSDPSPSAKAESVLKRLLGPLCRRYCFRRRRTHHRLAHHPFFSDATRPRRYKKGEIVELIKNHNRHNRGGDGRYSNVASVLSTWSREDILKLLQPEHASIRYCHHWPGQGEVLVYRGEPAAASGVIVVLSGSVEVLCDDEVVVLQSPFVLCDELLLVGGCHRRTIRTSGAAMGFVDCLVVSSSWFCELCLERHPRPRGGLALSSPTAASAQARGILRIFDHGASESGAALSIHLRQMPVVMLAHCKESSVEVVVAWGGGLGAVPLLMLGDQPNEAHIGRYVGTVSPCSPVELSRCFQVGSGVAVLSSPGLSREDIGRKFDISTPFLRQPPVYHCLHPADIVASTAERRATMENSTLSSGFEELVNIINTECSGSADREGLLQSNKYIGLVDYETLINSTRPVRRRRVSVSKLPRPVGFVGIPPFPQLMLRSWVFVALGLYPLQDFVLKIAEVLTGFETEQGWMDILHSLLLSHASSTAHSVLGQTTSDFLRALCSHNESVQASLTSQPELPKQLVSASIVTAATLTSVDAAKDDSEQCSPSQSVLLRDLAGTFRKAGAVFQDIDMAQYFECEVFFPGEIIVADYHGRAGVDAEALNGGEKAETRRVPTNARDILFIRRGTATVTQTHQEGDAVDATRRIVCRRQGCAGRSPGCVLGREAAAGTGTGRRTTYYTLSAGDVFGEWACVMQQPCGTPPFTHDAWSTFQSVFGNPFGATKEDTPLESTVVVTASTTVDAFFLRLSSLERLLCALGASGLDKSDIGADLSSHSRARMLYTLATEQRRQWWLRRMQHKHAKSACRGAGMSDVAAVVFLALRSISALRSVSDDHLLDLIAQRSDEDQTACSYLPSVRVSAADSPRSLIILLNGAVRWENPLPIDGAPTYTVSGTVLNSAVLVDVECPDRLSSPRTESIDAIARPPIMAATFSETWEISLSLIKSVLSLAGASTLSSVSAAAKADAVACLQKNRIQLTPDESSLLLSCEVTSAVVNTRSDLVLSFYSRVGFPSRFPLHVRPQSSAAPHGTTRGRLEQQKVRPVAKRKDFRLALSHFLNNPPPTTEGLNAERRTLIASQFGRWAARAEAAPMTLIQANVCLPSADVAVTNIGSWLQSFSACVLFAPRSLDFGQTRRAAQRAFSLAKDPHESAIFESLSRLLFMMNVRDFYSFSASASHRYFQTKWLPLYWCQCAHALCGRAAVDVVPRAPSLEPAGRFVRKYPSTAGPSGGHATVKPDPKAVTPIALPSVMESRPATTGGTAARIVEMLLERNGLPPIVLAPTIRQASPVDCAATTGRLQITPTCLNDRFNSPISRRRLFEGGSADNDGGQRTVGIGRGSMRPQPPSLPGRPVAEKAGDFRVTSRPVQVDSLWVFDDDTPLVDHAPANNAPSSLPTNRPPEDTHRAVAKRSPHQDAVDRALFVFDRRVHNVLSAYFCKESSLPIPATSFNDTLLSLDDRSLTPTNLNATGTFTPALQGDLLSQTATASAATVRRQSLDLVRVPKGESIPSGGLLMSGLMRLVQSEAMRARRSRRLSFGQLLQGLLSGDSTEMADLPVTLDTSATSTYYFCLANAHREDGKKEADRLLLASIQGVAFRVSSLSPCRLLSRIVPPPPLVLDRVTSDAPRYLPPVRSALATLLSYSKPVHAQPMDYSRFEEAAAAEEVITTPEMMRSFIVDGTSRCSSEGAPQPAPTFILRVLDACSLRELARIVVGANGESVSGTDNTETGSFFVNLTELLEQQVFANIDALTTLVASASAPHQADREAFGPQNIRCLIVELRARYEPELFEDQRAVVDAAGDVSRQFNQRRDARIASRRQRVADERTERRRRRMELQERQRQSSRMASAPKERRRASRQPTAGGLTSASLSPATVMIGGGDMPMSTPTTDLPLLCEDNDLAAPPPVLHTAFATSLVDTISALGGNGGGLAAPTTASDEDSECEGSEDRARHLSQDVLGLMLCPAPSAAAAGSDQAHLVPIYDDMDGGLSALCAAAVLTADDLADLITHHRHINSSSFRKSVALWPVVSSQQAQRISRIIEAESTQSPLLAPSKALCEKDRASTARDRLNPLKFIVIATASDNFRRLCQSLSDHPESSCVGHVNLSVFLSEKISSESPVVQLPLPETSEEPSQAPPGGALFLQRLQSFNFPESRPVSAAKSPSFAALPQIVRKSTTTARIASPRSSIDTNEITLPSVRSPRVSVSEGATKDALLLRVLSCRNLPEARDIGGPPSALVVARRLSGPGAQCTSDAPFMDKAMLLLPLTDATSCSHNPQWFGLRDEAAPTIHVPLGGGHALICVYDCDESSLIGAVAVQCDIERVQSLNYCGGSVIATFSLQPSVEKAVRSPVILNTALESLWSSADTRHVSFTSSAISPSRQAFRSHPGAHLLALVDAHDDAMCVSGDKCGDVTVRLSFET